MFRHIAAAEIIGAADVNHLGVNRAQEGGWYCAGG
jgi:hypothetical protein